MTKTLSVCAAFAAPLMLAACGAHLQPLKEAPAPVAAKAPAALEKRVPLPVVVEVQAPDTVPSWGGSYTYPVKRYLEKAFSDAGQSVFASLGAAGDYAYQLEVQALSTKLKDAGKGKMSFGSELNTVLRDPEGKVVSNKNFSAEAASAFDGQSVPEAVWLASYDLAGQFAAAAKTASWLRGALAAKPAAGPDAAKIQAMVEAAVKGKDQKPVLTSDVDTAGYKLAENPDDFAIVVGIEKYSGIADANFAERDADSVRAHLLALGYPERNILMLKGSQAVRSGIVKYVETWLPKNVTAKSHVFFYFSGHGAPDVKTGQAYLVPWDGDPSYLEETAYPVKRLYEKLAALPAKSVVVAMDSCFSGAGGRSVIPAGARPLVSKVDQGGVPPGKLTVLAAADGDQISGTESAQGHGLFTYYLLKDLNDKKGASTVKDAYDFLSPKVADAARRENRDQTPKLLGGEAEAQLR